MTAANDLSVWLARQPDTPDCIDMTAGTASNTVLLLDSVVTLLTQCVLFGVSILGRKHARTIHTRVNV